jgi:hypothetical protein
MYKEIAYQAAETALSIIKSGDRVYVHGSAMTPNFLLAELAKQATAFTKCGTHVYFCIG